MLYNQDNIRNNWEIQFCFEDITKAIESNHLEYNFNIRYNGDKNILKFHSYESSYCLENFLIFDKMLLMSLYHVYGTIEFSY